MIIKKIVGGIAVFAGIAGLIYSAAVMGGAPPAEALRIALVTTGLFGLVIVGACFIIDGE